MMFNSLRSRLWITYALIVVIVIMIVSVGIWIALRRSPLLYRQAIYQLEVASELLVRRLNLVVSNGGSRIVEIFKEESANTNVKFALFDKNGTFLSSNFKENELLIRSFSENFRISDENLKDVFPFEDLNGNQWFVRVRDLQRPYFLLSAVSRPVYQFRTIMQDEFLGPLLQAGFVVLIIAFFISLVIANWIAIPLKLVSESAEALSEGELLEIPMEGPKEVRRLAETFNVMSKKVVASARSQREFVANVSHEFKTPLTSIQGYSQALLDGTVNKKEDINKAADVIMIETNRLHRLVNDLLTLAKLEAGTADFTQEKVSIKSILENMGDKFSLVADEKEIQFDIINIDDVYITGDGDRIVQVFSNLIDNAIKYTDQGGKIIVSSKLINNRVVISIKDSGIGIDDKTKSKIFDRFFQVDSSKKYGKKKGFGLGLSIAKEIVQAHKGKIWVESKEGKGSTFFVELPLLNENQ